MIVYSADAMYKAVLKRVLCSFVGIAFISTSIISPAYAQAVFNLPKPGDMIGLSEAFAPVVLKGVSIHPEDPLLFDFIVDNGQTGLAGQALTDETTKLVKYFLAGLAVPEKDLWVNLSPVEKDRIMADDLSHTDVGRDMLAQDYILKQVTSTLMYPEKDLGRQFWAEVYKRTYAQFGNTDVPVDSFNKVWITPDEATVYQNGNNAFVAGSHLKVMLESDYEAQAALPTGGHGAPKSDFNERGSVSLSGLPTSQPLDMKASQGADLSTTIARDVVRSVILPVLEKEVNEGRNFAALRQVFQSMILAGWYKKALKESLLNQVYANTNKVEGIDIPQKDAKQQVYAQYMEAFQKGVYNYIKEEFDQNTKETVPHKYFSGGIVDLAQAKISFDLAEANNVKPAGVTSKFSYKMQAVKAWVTNPAEMWAKKKADRLHEEQAAMKAVRDALTKFKEQNAPLEGLYKKLSVENSILQPLEALILAPATASARQKEMIIRIMRQINGFTEEGSIGELVGYFARPYFGDKVDPVGYFLRSLDAVEAKQKVDHAQALAFNSREIQDFFRDRLDRIQSGSSDSRVNGTGPIATYKYFIAGSTRQEWTLTIQNENPVPNKKIFKTFVTLMDAQNNVVARQEFNEARSWEAKDALKALIYDQAQALVKIDGQRYLAEDVTRVVRQLFDIVGRQTDLSRDDYTDELLPLYRFSFTEPIEMNMAKSIFNFKGLQVIEGVDELQMAVWLAEAEPKNTLQNREKLSELIMDALLSASKAVDEAKDAENVFARIITVEGGLSEEQARKVIMGTVVEEAGEIVKAGDILSLDGRANEQWKVALGEDGVLSFFETTSTEPAARKVSFQAAINPLAFDGDFYGMKGWELIERLKEPFYQVPADRPDMSMKTDQDTASINFISGRKHTFGDIRTAVDEIKEALMTPSNVVLKDGENGDAQYGLIVSLIAPNVNDRKAKTELVEDLIGQPNLVVAQKEELLVASYAKGAIKNTAYNMGLLVQEIKLRLAEIEADINEQEKSESIDNAGTVQGGIDLGQGDYLKVIATDAAGMPQFDPAQVQQLQKDLRGIIPVPVGLPQPVNLGSLLGLN